jgi:ATP-dependent DNA helicase RecG
LIEKRISKAKTFDALPCWEADLQDLNLPTIQLAYLPLAIDKEILEANHRDLKQQLASLRLYDLKQDKPTNAGILLFGNNTQYFFSGAYLQYVRLDGKENKMGNIIAEQQFKGNLYEILHNIDNFIKHNICISRPVPVEDTFREKQISNYPFWALRELVMNAVMHRDYESYAPIYIYEYAEKIEIHNAGYLYGSVNRNNFPHQNDYRNPIIAEAMRYLGYINRFNYGIQRAQELLAENHNPPATFNLDLITKLSVSIEISLNW